MHQRVHRLADLLLGVRVHGGRGLIQDQDLRIAQDDAGDGQQLALPLADVLRVVGQARVIAVGQRAHEVVDVCHLGGLDDLLAGGVRPAVRDVFGDGAVEQPGVLQHHAEVAAQVHAVHIMRVHAVEADMAAVDLVESHEQVDQRGLAGAGRADDGGAVARLGRERDVLHQRTIRIVSELHMLEVDAAADWLGHPLRLGGIGFDLVLVQDVEHALHRSQGRLQAVDHERHLGQRFRGLVDVLEECLERADRQVARDEEESAQHRDEHLREAGDQADGRVDCVRDEIGASCRVGQILRGLVDAA